MIPLERVRSLERDGLTSTALDVKVGHEPKTYWRFAAEDLNDGHGDRSLINAFSNAKRALHFQVETLADAFGRKHASLGRQPPFRKTADFCSRCGIVTPRILRKLNLVRNAMEHEYYIPTRHETEDFVDVVQLFLESTDPYLKYFPIDVELVSDKDDYVEMKIEPGAGMINVVTHRLGEYTGEESFFAKQGSLYFDWVSILVDKSA